ncbi:MAG: tetratricopeptide repeat protein [Candidatus Woykebacteria bacterium]
MKENISILSFKTVQVGLVILAFLIPLFFLPTTSEFYNFNKTTLLTIGAFFLFFVWSIRMVAEQRVKMTRTALDIPLLIFLGVYIIATVFSVDPVVSFLGWHPVFFGSLPSVAALVIIYFLATTHLDSSYRKVIVLAICTSASILAALLIAYYFGHPLVGTDWAQLRSWTPAGDLNKLVAFLGITIPLTFSLSFLLKVEVGRYLAFALAALQIIAFALINSLFGYVILAIAALVILIFLPRLSLSVEEKVIFGALGALLAAIILMVNIQGLGDSILKPLIAGENTSVNITKPIRLPITSSWQTGARAISDRPVFGTGPSTFGLIFPTYKPLSLNRVNENNLWNIRFDESGSGVLDILATTGVVGALAFILVIVVLVRSVIKFSARGEATRGRTEFVFLQGAMVAALASLIFFNLSILNSLALIFLIAIFFSTLRDWGSNLASEVSVELIALRSGAIRQIEGESKSPNSLAWVFFIPALILFAGIIFYSWSSYLAEINYQKAILNSQANKGSETREALVAAINANPYRDTYHRALLVTDLALARSLNQQGQLNEEQQTTLLALVREAIDQGRIITGYEGRGLGQFQVKRVPGTSSVNVANWESIATVYANIGGELRSDASAHAINTYTQAINLDPTNPRLYEALGNVYFNVGDVDNAIKNYEIAVAAKGDYASGHYNLAQAVRRKGDNPARVVNELRATLQLLRANETANEDQIKQVEDELKEAEAELAKTQQSQQQQQQRQELQLQQEQSTSSALPSSNPGQ